MINVLKRLLNALRTLLRNLFGVLHDSLSIRIVYPSSDVTAAILVIAYDIIHARREATDLTVRYSIGGGSAQLATPATSHSKHEGTVGLSSSAAGTRHYFAWDWQKDLPGVNPAVNIVLHLQGMTKTGKGADTKSPPFTIDAGIIPVNQKPRIRILPPSGVLLSGENVEINYVVSDAESDPVHIEVEYSIDNGTTFHVATEGNHPASEGTSGLRSSPSGEPHKFIWKVIQDLPAIPSPGVVMRIQPYDLRKGDGDVTAPFSIGAPASNHPPAVRILSPVPNTEQGSAVEIRYELKDDNSDRIRIEVLYSSDQGLTFLPATEANGLGSGGTINLASSPTGVSHIFFWKAANDLVTLPATDILIQIQAFDAAPGGIASVGQLAISSNHPPLVQITAPAAASTQHTPVNIEYVLTDREGDLCNIEASYSLDQGRTFVPATSHSSGDGTRDLVSSPTGEMRVFQWNAERDLGPSAAQQVLFKIQAADRSPGGISVSDPFDVALIAGIPSVTILQPAACVWGTPVPVVYRLSVSGGTQHLAITVSFSLDNGASFTPATEATQVDSGGVTNLLADANGVIHFFAWDAEHDIPGLRTTPQHNILLRVETSTPAGPGSAVSEPLHVDSSFSGVPAYSVPTGTNRRPEIEKIFFPAFHHGIHIPAHFLLKFDDHARANVIALFNVNDGPYRAATPAPYSDQLTNLAAPKMNAQYRFVWDAAADLRKLGLQSGRVKLKFTPYAGGLRGAEAETNACAFTIRLPDTLPAVLPKIPLHSLRIIKLAGDNQHIIAGQLPPESLSVEVRDMNNRVVQGARVTFSLEMASPVTVAFEEDPNLRTTTDYYGRAAIRVRPQQGRGGVFKVLVKVVGVPGVVESFSLESHVPTIKGLPGNPAGYLEYGKVYPFHFYLDIGQAIFGRHLCWDEVNPVKFKVTARHAEVAATYATLPGPLAQHVDNSIFRVDLTPSHPGGITTSTEFINLKIEALNLTGVMPLEINNMPVATGNNAFHLRDIVVVGNSPQEVIDDLRLTLHVISGHGPDDPADAGQRSCQKAFHNGTLLTPFQVEVKDESAVPLYATSDLLRSTDSTTVPCGSTVTRADLKIQWSAVGGVLSTTPVKGTSANLEVPVTGKVYFTPTGAAPWSVTAGFSGNIFDGRSQPNDYTLSRNTTNAAGNPIVVFDNYCVYRPGIRVDLSRTFFIHPPDSVGIEHTAKATASAYGPLLSQVKSGMKVRILVQGLSPLASQSDLKITVESLLSSGLNVPAYSGTALTFKQDVILRSQANGDLRSDELVIVQNENRTTSGIGHAVLPLGKLKVYQSNVFTAAKISGLKRERLRWGAAGVDGDTEFMYESPVGTSPASGALDSVTLHNGEFVYSGCDLGFPSREGEISIGRTYRSQMKMTLDRQHEAEVAEPFGPGWFFGSTRYLEVSHKHLRFWDGRGMYFNYPFDYPGKGQFIFISRNLTVSDDRSAYEIMDCNRNVLHFNIDGTLRFLVDPKGNKYAYEYNEQGQLIKIKDCLTPDSRFFSVSYYDDNQANRDDQCVGQIREIKDFADRTVHFEYYKKSPPASTAQSAGGPGFLKQVTFAKCKATFEGGASPDDEHRSIEVYEYEADAQLGWRLKKVKTLNTKNILRDLITNHYANGRVIKQEHGEGEFVFTELTTNTVEYKDKNQATTRLLFPASPYWDATAPEEVTDPGTFITKLKHNHDGLVTRQQIPSGGSIEYVYDEDSQSARRRSNLLMEIQTAATGEKRISRFTYDGRFQKILTAIGPEGNLPDADPELYTFVFNYDHQRNAGDCGNVVDCFGPRTLSIVYKPVANDQRQPEWTAENPAQTFTYNTFGMVTSHVDTVGVKREFLYYPADTPTTGIPLAGGGGFLAEVRFDTETSNKRTQHLPGQDAIPQMKITKYKYNPIGYLVQTETEAGVVTTYTPNQLGEVILTETGSNINGLRIINATSQGPNGELISSTCKQPSSGGTDQQTVIKTYAYKNDGTPDSCTEKVNDNMAVKQSFVFDKGDRLKESYHDLSGIKSTHLYNDRGLETDTVITSGTKTFTTKRTFSNSGVCETITDTQDNSTTTFITNGFDEVVKVKYPEGITTEAILNSAGIPVVSLRKNNMGEVTAASEFVRDEYGRPRKRYDLLFNGVVGAPTAAKKVARLSENLGTNDKMYLPDHGASVQTNPRVVNEIANDLAGNCVRLIEGQLTPQFYRYDGLGRPVESEDGAGNRTIIVSNDATRETETICFLQSDDPIHPDQCTIKLKTKLDAAGRLVQMTNHMGHAVRGVYDEAGKLLQISDAMGALSTETYDGQPGSAALNAPGNVITFRHDTYGRMKGSEFLLKVFDPITAADRTAEFNEYNTANKLQCDDTFDDMGRLTEKTDARGNQFQFKYENNFLKEVIFASSASGNNPKVSYTYDASGRLETITDAKGTIYRRSFQKNRLEKISIDGTNRGLSLDYDHQGNIASLSNLSDPDTKLGWTYNSLGQPVEEKIQFRQNTTVKQLITQNEYDPTGKLSKKKFSEGDFVSYEHEHKTGLLREVKNQNGALAKFFYMGNAMPKRRVVKGVDTVYKYNEHGQVEEKKITGLGTGDIITTFRYDRMQRVVEEVETINGQATKKEFTYDTAGRLVEEKKTLPPGTAPVPLVSKYFYDANNLLLKEVRDEFDPQSGVVVTRTVVRERDALGRIAKVTETVQAPAPVVIP